MAYSHQPHRAAEPRVKALDAPALSPLAEVGVNGLPRREAFRQHAPLATRFEKVKERVHDLARRMLGVGALISENGFDNLPLGVRQVGAICLLHKLRRVF